MVTFNTFPPNLDFPPPWQTVICGGGNLSIHQQTLRFSNINTTATTYTNAQLDDYQQLTRRDFLWRPPLHLTVRARFSHPAGQLSGTAGFGFWNDPFMMTGWRRPTLPRVIWFFYSSPPSNMKLDLNTPGHGWKAGTLDALRWPFFALLPTAPIAVPLMHLKPLYNLCWPLGQRAISVREALLPVCMTDWHTYTLHWHEKTAEFWVDDQAVLSCDSSPRGPLGFVMWFDNQFMIITPWGRFASGILESSGEQWMEVSQLTIDRQ